MSLPAVIPCAGRGTRLRPVSRYLSKPMLPIGSTPVIKFVVDEAINAGCDPVVLVRSPDDNDLVDYVDRLDESAQIIWAVQDHPRGLADALLRGYRSLDHDGDVAMLLPDNIVLDGNGVGSLLSEENEAGLLRWGKTLVTEREAHYFGNSGDYETDAKNPGGRETVLALQPKQDGHFIDRDLDWPAPRLIGRLVLPPLFFEIAGDMDPDPATGELDDVPVYRRMLESNRGITIPVSGQVFDMGEPENYLRLMSWYFEHEAKRHHD